MILLKYEHFVNSINKIRQTYPRQCNLCSIVVQDSICTLIAETIQVIFFVRVNANVTLSELWTKEQEFEKILK